MLVEFTVAGFTAPEKEIWIAAVVLTPVAPAAGTVAMTETLFCEEVVLLELPQPIVKARMDATMEMVRTNCKRRNIWKALLGPRKADVRCPAECKRLVLWARERPFTRGFCGNP